MKAEPMPQAIHEPPRQTPVRDAFDVAVVGGGIAGVAAAVSAARAGRRVCLLEREYALGGLATLGLVVIYLPLCDGRGRLVSRGLAEELLLLSVAGDPDAIPEAWRAPGASIEKRAERRYRVDFQPVPYLLALEALIRKEGVHLLYGAHFAAVHAEGDRIAAVLVETKAGREALACGAIVDATGDADVFFAAGEPTVSSRLNSAAGWYYARGPQGAGLRKLSEPYDPFNASMPPGASRGYAGNDPAEITAQVLAARDRIRADAAAHGEPTLVPTLPCLRMTRRLAGRVEMGGEDRRDYEDGIGLIGDWRQAGPVYAIPFAALQGVRYRNLFAAGRCISATGYGWEMTRAIPACAVTGEAAGLAAAMGDGLSTPALQHELRRRGVLLSMGELSDKDS